MTKRRIERITAVAVSIALLMTTTGIVSTLAANVSESSSALTSAPAETSASAEVTQEGGKVTTSVTEEGGQIQQPENNGDGTAENPYKISTLEELLAVSGKINVTTNGNKYFLLTADIDLSGVKASDFENGALISADKSLEASANVYFVFDGGGHSLKNLDIKLTKGESAAIFGEVGKNSTIKNLVLNNCKLEAASEKLTNAAILALENKGTISNVQLIQPVLTAAVSANAGLVAAVNDGTVTNVTLKSGQTNASTATAEKHTVSAAGNVGAVAGINKGKISSVTASNIGMFIPSDAEKTTVYGGIAGLNAGSVTNSVSVGNVMGERKSDCAGGLVGKAVAGTKLTNNYTLVTISDKLGGCALIGVGGDETMLKDCYWSSGVSGKDYSFPGGGMGENDLSSLSFKVVKQGKTASVTTADLNSRWGQASFELGSDFSFKGDGASAEISADSVRLTGTTPNTVSRINYTAKIKLPETVGAGSGSVTLSQYMHIAVLCVSEKAVGDGTAESPFVIDSAAQLSFFKSAQGINAKLGKDLAVNGGFGKLYGTLDGDGHTVTVNAPLFTAVFGTIKNINLVLAANVSDAVLGNLNGRASDVSLSVKQGAKLNAAAGSRGLMFNVIGLNSTVNGCSVKGDIEIASAEVTNVGALAGAVSGKGAVITNCSASSNITVKPAEAKETTAARAVAPFIGCVSADDVQIKNSCVSGANLAGSFAFIGELKTKKITLENVYYTKSGAEGAAAELLDFKAYKDFVNSEEFSEWSFDCGNTGFFTGAGGEFSITLPDVKAFDAAKADDFTVSCDSTKAAAKATVNDGKLVLHVSRAAGVVTVKALPITVTNVKTGLSAVIVVSNGLEKDANGNFVISTAYDLAYVSENIADLHSASFVMTSDVDMASVGNFAPIGSTAVTFSGKLDGRGHVISNLKINSTAKVGLFAALDGARVENLVFKNADVTSQGGYAAVLAGQALGKTVISNITLENSKVVSSGLSSALVVGSVDGSASGLAIKNVTVSGGSVTSTANYVGAVAGSVNSFADISQAAVSGFNASGADYVSGVVGLAGSEDKIDIKNVSVTDSKISGVNNVSGVASGNGKGAEIAGAVVKNTEIATLGTASAYAAGGIAAAFGSSISDVKVKSVTVTAGAAGGVVGRSAADCGLIIKNTEVISSNISSSKTNTVAAGVLAVHNVSGTAALENVYVDANTVVYGASVTAGIVGDCSGSGAQLTVSGGKSFAAVKGCETESAVSAAGILGRVGASAVNNIQLVGVKVGGTVSGKAVLGGAVGLIKDGNEFTSDMPLISGCVVYPEIKTTDSRASVAMLIGALEDKNNINNGAALAAGTVISTCFGSVNAYPGDSGLTGGYVDMDKPGNKAISASVSVLSSAEATKVEITNTPTVEGFAFDASVGWISESSERIEVVESTETTALLKANHPADISVMAYYVSESDPEVRVPVHFRMTSDIRTPLKGSGTQADPYLISGAYDLETMAQYADKQAYFVLTQDIVFTPEDFEFGGAFYNVGNGIVTIGTAESGFNGRFSGLYNGKVHSVSGLKVSGNTFGGLFGALNSAVISDLIINDAQISALTYGAVVAGNAVNSVIKNVTVNSATVETVDKGSFAAAVVACAQGTTIENVTVNSASVKTPLNAGGAAAEVAGGVAACFDGSVSNVKLNGVTVASGMFAGGVIGRVKAENVASVINAETQTDVTAKIAGGIFGRLEEPTSGAADCLVKGSVTADEISAGVIAQVVAEDGRFALDKAEKSLLRNVVVTAKVSDAAISGVIVGSASENIFTDKANSKINVFDGVYYSSYQNSALPFGTQAVNAYQNSEYTVTDMNEMLYTADGEQKTYLPLASKTTVLAPDSIAVNGAQGGYLSFKVGSSLFNLKTITSDPAGYISYNSLSAEITVASGASDLKAVFVYDNGLELAIPVSTQSSFEGLGTEESPYLISDTETFKLMLQNASESGVYYKLTDDISLAGVASAPEFGGVLDGGGHVLYDYTGESLFTSVTGEVRSLGLAGFSVTGQSSDAAGALAAVLNGATVENVVVIADVTAKNAQDVGVLAGRMVNGAKVSDVLTSGKAVGANALAVGGIVGAMSNSSIQRAASTAYVNGAKLSGGIVGDASYSAVNSVIFANMAESAVKSGSVVGAADEASHIAAAYFDKSAARAESQAFEAEALTTAQLSKLRLDGFEAVGGYPVPAALTAGGSAKFNTAVGFASILVRYLAGLNAGDAYNYSEIKTDDEVNSNKVTLSTDDGFVITLVPTADYSGCANAVERYSNPPSSSAVSVSCNIVDFTSNASLGDALIGVQLRSKLGESASTFDFFTSASAEATVIDAACVADGKLYVSALLKQGCKYSVAAADENGAALQVDDMRNEGFLVNIGSSASVSISITVENEGESAWGLRSLWTAIGK